MVFATHLPGALIPGAQRGSPKAHYIIGFTHAVRHPRHGKLPPPTPKHYWVRGLPSSHLRQPRQEAGNDAAYIPLVEMVGFPVSREPPRPGS